MNSFHLNKNSNYYFIDNYDCNHYHNYSYFMNFADDYFYNSIIDYFFKCTFYLSSAQ